LIGKWKVSQNRPAVDRAGVVAGLSKANDEDSLALAIWVSKMSNP
jgi:predicted FMN-binding regulatory protein PaiB